MRTMSARSLTVCQLLPALNAGGVERGSIEVARALVAAGHRAIVVSAGGRMTEELATTGAEHITLPIGRKHPAVLATLPRLRRLLLERDVDIVHLRSRLPAWIGRMAAGLAPAAQRPRLVTTVHGPYTVNRYAHAMLCGDRIIAISEFIRGYITTNYPFVDPARIVVIPRGVSRVEYPSDYAPPAGWRDGFDAEFPELAGRRWVVLPARLTHWKGQQDFIEVFARIASAHDDVVGVLVGGHDPERSAYRDQLLAALAERDLRQRVVLTGHRNDLKDILASAELAVSFTREPEAFGRTTIEALSVGTPVIGYDHGGTGEILRRVYPAGLVTPLDLDAAAARLAAMLDDAPPVPAAHPYTLERMLEATLAVYSEITGVSVAS
ncbi:MAG: glycosyltransferase [Gammaproteobacteria bacterium]|nr:glycosyltransferase [Gammaproteobacteria bacterium]